MYYIKKHGKNECSTYKETQAQINEPNPVRFEHTQLIVYIL